MRINQSRIKTWRTCQQQHHYKYVQQLQTIVPPRPLAFGSLVHEMIEADANNQDPFDVLEKVDVNKLKMFKQEQEEYGNILDDIEVIMIDYWDYWGEDSLVPVKINGKFAEHKFKVDLFDGVTWEGKIDMFGRTPNKLRWLVEHKTFSTLPNEDERWRNIQSTTYHRAVEIMGWPSLDGTLWDYICSKPPSEPAINKDGSISKRSLRTLPTKLSLWAKQNKRKIPGDMMARARENRDYWFQRMYSTKKKYVIDQVWKDFVTSAQEIVDEGEKKKTKNIGRWCSWCSYESICRAELTAGDVDFVKSTQYVVENPDKRYDVDNGS